MFHKLNGNNHVTFKILKNKIGKSSDIFTAEKNVQHVLIFVAVLDGNLGKKFLVGFFLSKP